MLGTEETPRRGRGWPPHLMAVMVSDSLGVAALAFFRDFQATPPGIEGIPWNPGIIR